jgi:hypothetical protein
MGIIQNPITGRKPKTPRTINTTPSTDLSPQGRCVRLQSVARRKTWMKSDLSFFILDKEFTPVVVKLFRASAQRLQYPEPEKIIGDAISDGPIAANDTSTIRGMRASPACNESGRRYLAAGGEHACSCWRSWNGGAPESLRLRPWSGPSSSATGLSPQIVAFSVAYYRVTREARSRLVTVDDELFLPMRLTTASSGPETAGIIQRSG